jgi:hypothetical protein
MLEGGPSDSPEETVVFYRVLLRFGHRHLDFSGVRIKPSFPMGLNDAGDFTLRKKGRVRS